MNPQNLAEAVVHWTSYELLCDRQMLLSEAGLRLPIGQFLQGSQRHKVVPEQRHPGQTGKNPKRFDYCLKRNTGDTIVHAIESKWIGKKARPVLVDEIFDDIYRLASLRWPGQGEPCEKWLVLAGVQKYIEDGLITRRLHDDGSTVSAFGGVLDFGSAVPKLHHIYDVGGAPIQPWANKWRTAAEELNQTELLSSISTVRQGIYPANPTPDTMVAYVWRISAPRGAGHKAISELFPPITGQNTAVTSAPE